MKVDWLVVRIFCKNKVVEVSKFLWCWGGCLIGFFVLLFLVKWIMNCPYIIPQFIAYYVAMVVLAFFCIIIPYGIFMSIKEWLQANVSKAKREAKKIRECRAEAEDGLDEGAQELVDNF